MSQILSATSRKVEAETTASRVMPLQRTDNEEMRDRSKGRIKVEQLSNSTSFLGHTRMAPNSKIANLWPVRVGTVVSTSKKAISDRSSSVEPIISEWRDRERSQRQRVVCFVICKIKDEMKLGSPDMAHIREFALQVWFPCAQSNRYLTVTVS